MIVKSVIIIALLIIGYGLFIISEGGSPQDLINPLTSQNPVTQTIEQVKQILPTPAPKITLLAPPPSKTLPGTYHVFQSFNNCGPAAMSMALSYYGINVSQAELGQALRPYQLPSGVNDDKSVTLEELAEKGKEYNLIPYHRPNGDFEKIKLFVTYDMPVITRTYLKPGEDIGHYRIIKGYDSTVGYIVQDDSLQGKNLRYIYSDFERLWKDFNFEYLVLVPKEKQEIAEAILGNDKNEKLAWERTVKNLYEQLKNYPDDTVLTFNLSVALYNVGDYQGSVGEFEKVENKLSFRTLWYQIEPIQAYFELGNYDRVFQITDRILNYHNSAFSELYLIRGHSYQKQGKLEAARSEFEKAVLYNKNLTSAQEALNSL